MTMDLHIVRKILIWYSFDRGTDGRVDYSSRRPYLHRITRPVLRQLPPPLIYAREVRESILVLNSPEMYHPDIESADWIRQSDQAPPNASLLAVPVVRNRAAHCRLLCRISKYPGSLLRMEFRRWRGMFLPAEPYMLHVYQNPGTYICELELVTPQGISTTAFTKITVKPRQG